MISRRVGCAALVLAALGTSPPCAAAAAAHQGPFHAELATAPARIFAGAPAELSFTVRDSAGAAVRFLQLVHERPLHLFVVSADLSSFDHVHPELGLGDAYHLAHTFPHGGAWRLYADYTPPGSGTIVERFDLDVKGPAPAAIPLVADRILSHDADGVRVTLTLAHPPVADQDVELVASLADAASAAPIHDLQLYLGALAHLILVSADGGELIHAHPLETGEVFDPTQGPRIEHTHDPSKLAKVLVGPSPSTLHAVTSFPRAGLYKLWFQFQRAGRVSTVPFVIEVAPAPIVAHRAASKLPASAIPIAVSSSGYAPARVDLPRGRPAVLAFTRTRAGNCAGTLVIPGLGIERALPVGQTVLVRFTPRDSADYAFSCAMGMFQGVIAVR